MLLSVAPSVAFASLPLLFSPSALESAEHTTQIHYENDMTVKINYAAFQNKLEKERDMEYHRHCYQASQHFEINDLCTSNVMTSSTCIKISLNFKQKNKNTEKNEKIK